MNGTLAERAIESLHDYAVFLREGGDFSDRLMRTRKERAPRVRATPPNRQKQSEELETLTTAWENGMIRKWRSHDRLMSDGVLRVENGEAPRWTISEIGSSFPQLNGLDRWAVLIAADGVYREEEMSKDPNQNIREVIEKIIETQLKRILRDELTDIFADVLEQVKKEIPMIQDERSVFRVGGRKQIHRVRHPLTQQLVSREEREAYLSKHPKNAEDLLSKASRSAVNA